MDNAISSHPEDATTPGGGALLPRLQVSDVSKTFGHRTVLKDMRIQLAPGELHTIVGQNGSGKSTLVKILTGIQPADSGGSIQVDGTELGHSVSVPVMRQVGLSVVHQTLGLIEDATVVENVRAGRFGASRFGRRINWEAERDQVRAVLARLGRSVNLDVHVSKLSAEDRATVAIARAFQDLEPGEGIIIFDESTRALTAESLVSFYEMVNTVRAAGTAVLMVSHRLDEVLRVSDKITVLRDGEVTAEGTPCSQLDETALVKLMIGRELAPTGPRARQRHRLPGGKPGVNPERAVGAKVSGLSAPLVRDFAVEIEPGEIVGVTGLIGSGYEQIPYLLGGALRAHAGTLALGDHELDLTKLSDPINVLKQADVALVPEKRVEEGLALDMSVTENITLPRLLQKGNRLWTGLDWQREETELMIRRLDIKPPLPDALVGTLSGGNQQKVLLAKWLVASPKLLLLHEPTQAVDVGARADIVHAVRRAAESGAAVLAAGSDPQELRALCDRVLVLRNGRLESELTGDFSEDEIIAATFGAPAAV